MNLQIKFSYFAAICYYLDLWINGLLADEIRAIVNVYVWKHVGKCVICLSFECFSLLSSLSLLVLLLQFPNVPILCLIENWFYVILGCLSLNPEVHPQCRHFQYFLPQFFFQSHFSCSLNFFKELLCSKLTVEMWSDLRIFQRKGDCWMINYWHTFLSFASIFWKLLKVCSWSPCFPPFSPSWSCRSPYKETHWWFKW